MKISRISAFIFAFVVLAAFQATSVSAQSSAEIERLTAAIAKAPENDQLYVERGTRYTWLEKFIGPNVPYADIGKTIDDNRAFAKADAEKAIKINKFNYRAYTLRGIVSRSLKNTVESKKDFEMAAKLRSESNIVGSIYKVDLSGGKAFYPPYTLLLLNVVVKGDQKGAREGFDTQAAAKDLGKRNKKPHVIMFNSELKKYFLYEAFATENIYPNVQLAETPFAKVLKDKSNIPLTYEFLKIDPEYSVQSMPKDAELDIYPVAWTVVDILDAEGLTLFKAPRIPLMRGSKGVRYLMDSELEKSNVDEAVKIYQWLEKINVNGQELDVVKITRKTNLSKMFRASEKLRPFVEKEMAKHGYGDADKAAVRGTK